jgi:low affinity Fe/Cu permease
MIEMNEQGTRTFEHAARRVFTKRHMPTLSLCLVLILLLAAAEPVERYLGTLGFTLHAGITGLAFVSVFLIERSGKRHTEAMEVEFSQRSRRRRYLGKPIVHVEKMSEEELDRLHAYYQRLSDTKD